MSEVSSGVMYKSLMRKRCIMSNKVCFKEQLRNSLSIKGFQVATLAKCKIFSQNGLLAVCLNILFRLYA